VSNITEGTEYAELLERKGEKITDFEQLTRLIEDETEKVAGKQKAVSAVPLRIKFYCKDVVNLMLVDLPGITKVSLKSIFKYERKPCKKDILFSSFSLNRIQLEINQQISSLSCWR